MKNHKFNAVEQGGIIAVRHHKWAAKVEARGETPMALAQMPDHYFGQLQETGIGQRCSMATVKAHAISEWNKMGYR